MPNKTRALNAVLANSLAKVKKIGSPLRSTRQRTPRTKNEFVKHRKEH